MLVFTDSNLTRLGDKLGNESSVDRNLARVGEYQDEGNNVTATPLTIALASPPDLRVASVTAPERVTAGQTFAVQYTVTNAGPGDTPPRQDRWDDLIYLSRDPLLDLNQDVFVGFSEHTGGLAAGASYQISSEFKAPLALDGAYYVFVITDPARTLSPQGKVFENGAESNNSRTAPIPMVIDRPPPTDLQIESILVPGTSRSGEMIHVEWTGINAHPTTAAVGTWSDAVYLSADGVWDIGDRLIGRVQAATAGSLAPGQTYHSVLDAVLPPATPGEYRVIVRSDIFNEIYEQEFEANNRATSADAFSVTVDTLNLGVPLTTTLSSGQSRTYQVTVGLGQTLRVQVQTSNKAAAQELFVRYADVPTGVAYDAAYAGPLAANQVAVVPSTRPGVYYVLLRGYSEPGNDTPVTLLADLLPLTITDVAADIGGDSRWVTTTISGAQFSASAIVKLVRPALPSTSRSAIRSSTVPGSLPRSISAMRRTVSTTCRS